jgi:arginine decarboxylase-like protein
LTFPVELFATFRHGSGNLFDDISGVGGGLGVDYDGSKSPPFITSVIHLKTKEYQALELLDSLFN